MHNNLLASDRVLLLLSLVPYLREHGPTSIDELADTFEVKPALLRRLIGFLGTAGIPGETLSYQHDDLFDIDWDAFLNDDVVSLTQTVAIDDTPRFTGTETAALLAGLHALEGMLSPDDGELARNLAQRLSAALGVGETTAVSLSSDVSDERLATLIDATERHRTVQFRYRDGSGAESDRTVDPAELVQRQGVWYLSGFNHERSATRTFRVDQISGLCVLDEFEPGTYEADRRNAIHTIRATVPERLLPTLKGFAPKVVKPARGQLDAGAVCIEVEAWHSGTAVRLVQHAPGEIVVEGPEVARRAVRDWAERALEASAEGAQQALG